MEQRQELDSLDWAGAFQKVGMIVMTKVGGASGSLLGTLFLGVSKAMSGQEVNSQSFADAFSKAVNAVKLRGKSDAGEKTMLDVLIPVADYLQTASGENIAIGEMLESVASVAINGMESTRDMIATKGRASFLEERSRGHIDAGAKTSQLMICAVVSVLVNIKPLNG
jgi:dihydroxyacetone kinase-like protein